MARLWKSLAQVLCSYCWAHAWGENNKVWCHFPICLGWFVCAGNLGIISNFIIHLVPYNTPKLSTKLKMCWDEFTYITDHYWVIFRPMANVGIHMPAPWSIWVR